MHRRRRRRRLRLSAIVYSMLVGAMSLQKVFVTELFAAEVAIGFGVEDSRRIMSREQTEGGERVEGGQRELPEGERALVDVGHLGVEIEGRRRVRRRCATRRGLLAALTARTAAAAVRLRLALHRRRD